MSAHNLRATFEKGSFAFFGSCLASSFREGGLGNMLIKDLATYKTNY